MAKSAARPAGGPRVAPATISGRVALSLFGISLLLLLGRLFLRPLLQLPISFLVAFIAAAAAGLVALYAVALRHERGLSVFGVLIAGLFAAAFLAAESFGGGGQP